jgi:predicted ribosomally synthesized peptide with SipW-like signal peptide
MKSFWMSLMAVALVGGLVSGGLFAYFSDTETSEGNTFQAGTIDIKAVVQPKLVDGGDSGKQVWYKDDDGKIYLDVKPCQTGYIVYRITNEGMNPAEIYKYIMVDSIDNNEWVEPECVECGGDYIDPTNGECMDDNGTPMDPGDDIVIDSVEFGMDDVWFDLQVSFDEGQSWVELIPDPDFVTPDLTDCKKLADMMAAWIPLDPDGLPVDHSILVLQSFHLDPTITNFAQSDVMSFTEYFLGNQMGAPLPPTP